ncbi:hypothetical protein CIK06_02365 [Plantactinospora sp. KBS50]|nr:hypothetical protein CIK06_02365 [Plantactinospora sp. KBS50]
MVVRLAGDMPAHLWIVSGLVQDRRISAVLDHLVTSGKMLIVVAARPHGEHLAYREPTSSDCEDRDRAGRWDREWLIGG